MAKFDLKTFAELQGQGQGAFTSLGTAFGMPQCLLNLGNEALSILPSSVLREVNAVSNIARQKANELVRDAFRALLLDTGIIEFDTEQGIFKFVSDSSNFGLDRNEGGALSLIAGVGAAFGAAAGFGGQLYQNYQNVQGQIDSIRNCLQAFEDIQAYQGGNSADRKQELDDLNPDEYRRQFEDTYGAKRDGLRDSVNFIEQVDDLNQNIQGILSARREDPSLEPQFLPEYTSIVSGLDVDIVNEEGDPEVGDNEIIRLQFGPPLSTKGRFLLSLDGLYYDSQSGQGVRPVLRELIFRDEEIEASRRWLFEFAPNLGGKGTQISGEDFDKFFGTIFDKNIIDDSEALREYYDEDHFLQVIIGQRNVRTLELSSAISDLESGGASQALIENTRNTLVSEINLYEDKINRRKKQIEVAVKAPALGGGEVSFAPGEVPINDFSYLRDLNLPADLGRQRNLVLDQADVSGVVLPLVPTFVESSPIVDMQFAEDLIVADIGTGDIVFDGGASSTSGVDLSITPEIVTEGLFAIYNYLNTSVELPSSTNFPTQNCATNDTYNNAQIVSITPSAVFSSGLGIANFDGICKQSSVSPQNTSGLGAFCRLPETNEFQDWMYNSNGFTFETWAYIPSLNDLVDGWQPNGANSKYRLILSCENTGIKNLEDVPENLERVNADFGDGFTRGIMFGFTRDRRITQGVSPSDDDDLNFPTSSLSLFVAPTQSSSSGTVALLADNECAPGAEGVRNLNVDVHSEIVGRKLIHLSREFGHLVFSFDVVNNKLSIFFDGVSIATKPLTDLFGTSFRQPPRIPNFNRINSFSYNSSSVDSTAPNSLKNGPNPDQQFPLWILGGGYTDGISDGHFMGQSSFGILSGLRGFLGSTKFYSKPLDSSEVLNNYNAQSDFFKNIQMPQTAWELIQSA